jgi:hypothetical protein
VAVNLGAEDYCRIQQTFSAFAAGIDLRDWRLYRSVFTDEIDVDYSSYRAGSTGRMAADDWVARARGLFPGLQASQHFLSNLFVPAAPTVSAAKGEGRSVECRMYVRAEHVLANDDGDDRFTIGGYYTDRLVQAADQEDWRIAAVRLTVLWNSGNRHVLALASERAAANED